MGVSVAEKAVAAPPNCEVAGRDDLKRAAAAGQFRQAGGSGIDAVAPASV
jgi:hypothetical protein